MTETIDSYAGPKKGNYRLWHIPQIPGKSFMINFEYVADAVMVMELLEEYDAFQFAHKIKPDYCNVNGILAWSEREGCYDDAEDDLVGDIILQQMNQRWKVEAWNE